MPARNAAMPEVADVRRVLIADLPRHLGERVEIAGWLYNLRSKGKIHFLQLRDGSGRVQGVAVRGECDADCFVALGALKLEASLLVRGEVRADSRAPGGVELGVHGATVCHNPATDYPIAKKEHGIDFLLEHRHLWLRSARQEAMLRVRSRTAASMRRFFEQRGFTHVDTPILTSAIGESAGALFSLPYFDLGEAYLAQTGQLYLEAACAALGRVYNFGPTFRAEKSKTRRHLTEFWMLEAEVAFMDHPGNLELQEQLVSTVVAEVMAGCAAELETLGRDLTPLHAVQAPFPRLDYGAAVELLRAAGSAVAWGQDLGADDETILSRRFERPLFVVNYPRDVKAFYMKRNPDDPRTVLCADLLAPEGYGEVIGGSQREDDHDLLQARIREAHLPEEAYRWYLDLRRFGSVVHSGFGIGLERTVAWITGTAHVRESAPFPRTLSRIYP
jgi:asparaginyl-tRNA synthetase